MLDPRVGAPIGWTPLMPIKEFVMRVPLLIFPLIVLIGACSSSKTGNEAAPPQAAEPAPGHLGGCILLSPIGDVPSDLYQENDVAATDEYPPFTKKLTVRGLMLVARDDASDEFMRKVATTIREIFRWDEGLDLETQAEIIRNHHRYNSLIPVPVGRKPSFDQDEAAWDRIKRTNSVCDIIMQDVEGQVMEVVEHILHYVSDMGLHYTFPDEWGISEDSVLARAMQKSVDEGYYDVSGYNDIDEEEVRHRVEMQEFAYWVISTAWNLQETYGPNEDEWTIRNEEELKEKLPELYAAYERTVGRTMVAPSLETLASIGPTRAEEAGR